ncbi:hypothetical protein B6U79_04700 [Candidatus Bathyarchaeota archaeon ex4484_231]|nr:MAG: hypothetical protein B6U79_04700 [Candidatus Bathyarchaeota archaeon ex4484_231]
MKETTILEKEKVEPRKAVLIEGLPGQGLVGKIAAEYLARQLKAKKIADLYSPHFAYYVMVNKKGDVRLLRSEFYYWKNDQGETIGGYRKEVKGEPQVLASATSQELLAKATEAGAKNSPAGSPIVGTAGLLVGLAKFRGLDAACLLAETPGYLPDPKAAKKVLQVISRMLGFEVDLSELEKEIYRSEQIAERMKRIEEQRRVLERERKRIEEEKISYIS